MAYLSLPLCSGNRVPVDQQVKPKFLQGDEKAALITDVAIAALVSAVGVLALLQLGSFANLGVLSHLGVIGPEAATAMIGLGAGLVAIDLIKLMIQQRNHINELHGIAENELNERSALSQLRTENSTLNNVHQILEEKLNQAQQATRDAEARIQELEGAPAQIEQLTAQLNTARENLEEAKQQSEQQITGLKAQLQEAQNGSSVQTEQVQQLTARLEEVQHQHEQQVANLTARLQEAQNGSSEQTEQVQQLTARLEEANQNSERQINELRTQLQEADRGLNEKTTQVEELFAQVEEVSRNRDEATQKVVQLRAELEKAKSEGTQPAQRPKPKKVAFVDPASELKADSSAKPTKEQQQRFNAAITIEIDGKDYSLSNLNFNNLNEEGKKQAHSVFSNLQGPMSPTKGQAQGLQRTYQAVKQYQDSFGTLLGQFNENPAEKIKGIETMSGKLKAWVEAVLNLPEIKAENIFDSHEEVDQEEVD